jgi:Calponin homology (CH) domain
MSLDKDISQRMQDKYDPTMADEAKEWIEQCLGETLPDQDLMDTLKDGTILCQLLNVVTPGSMKFKASKMPFVQVSFFGDNVSSRIFILIEDGKYRQIPRWGRGTNGKNLRWRLTA